MYVSEIEHFLDCIREGISPLTDGRRGLELVKILEASTQSLKQGGSPVILSSMAPTRNGNGHGNGNGNGNGKGNGK